MDKSTDRAISISTRSITYGIFIVILLYALYFLRELVFVFLTSIVIASFVESGVKKMAKRGIGRIASVLIIYTIAMTLCGILLYLFIPVFAEQASQFAAFITKYMPANTDAVSSSIPFSDVLSNIENITSNASGGVLQTAVLVFGGLFNLVVLIVLSFYLSINDGGIETFLRIVSPAREAEYVVGLWKRTEHKIGLWFQGQLLLGVVVGVLIYLGLLVFNIKYSLLLALVAAVLELIPLGLILAAVPAIAAGFTNNGATGGLEVAGLYLIVQQFEANLISPLIVQKVVGISSLVVILSLLIGMKLAGFWGVMLAIPVAVCLMEFLSDVKKRKGLLG